MNELEDLRARVAAVEALADNPPGDCEGAGCIWPEDLRVALAPVGRTEPVPEVFEECDNNAHVCSCGTVYPFHSDDCNVWLNDVRRAR